MTSQLLWHIVQSEIRVTLHNQKYSVEYYAFSFLASGDSFMGLKAHFCTGKSTIHDVVVETCEAIWERMKDEVLPQPTTQHWERIEEGFRIRCHFPRCIGALDGKHIRIKAPSNTASLFHNYKTFFSTVLLALVDANYRFIYVDIGEYGSNSDGSVFRASAFGKKYLSHNLGIPGDKFLPNFYSDHPIPHVIVADEAFPLLPKLMRPYPKTHPTTLPKKEAVFNYQLSHARIVVENTFGIFTQRWHIFDRTIPLEAENVDKLIQACVSLHNYLVEDRPIAQMFAELNPEQRPYMHGNGIMRCIPRLPGYRSANDAQEGQAIYKDYFNSPQGSVSWQQCRVSYRLPEAEA